jgi:mannose-1-phosphate guanylyltransferase/mannose-6-phosphate isomerase
MTDLRVVVLAGGSGTRLWPLSRELYPKQFLNLTGEASMLQRTLNRVSTLSSAPPLIVCNEEHRFLVAEHCRREALPHSTIILEPGGKNTAPATTLAALEAMANGEDPVLLVMPSDHHIVDTDGFKHAIREAFPIAEQGSLVMFGCTPRGPATGFGYIRALDRFEQASSALRIQSFVEKPDSETATRMLDEGGYYWNSGMYMFLASRYLSDIKALSPQIYECCRLGIEQKTQDLDFIRPGPKFVEAPTDSIDYAVAEKTSNSVMLPIDIGWSDVGNWEEIWELSEKSEERNVTFGDVITYDTSESLIYSDDRLVTTIGIKNVVVVETSDAVLVADRNRVQDVSNIVKHIKRSTRTEHYRHDRVYRPWGSYQKIEEGSRFLVKRITVNPEAKLSLQIHHHRSEHWIVVQGTAEVTRDEEIFILNENESTYIPLGTRHRLVNPDKEVLHLIEVQVGDYLSEDDIVRLHDDYNRS